MIWDSYNIVKLQLAILTIMLQMKVASYIPICT